MELHELAAEARSYFTYTGSDNPSMRDNIWVRTDNAPDWIESLCYAASGDFLPDDWRYEFTVDALDWIKDEDNDPDDPEIEADTYTHHLLQWLSSNLNRVGYTDEAKEAYGEFDSITSQIGAGQVLEKEEVYQAVLEFLRERLEELEVEEEEVDEG